MGPGHGKGTGTLLHSVTSQQLERPFAGVQPGICLSRADAVLSCAVGQTGPQQTGGLRKQSGLKLPLTIILALWSGTKRSELLNHNKYTRILCI